MREYTLYLSDGAKGFPRPNWSPTWNDKETLPGLLISRTNQKENTNMSSALKPMALATVAELAHGSPIVCLECKLVKLNAQTLRGKGQYGDWVLQFGELSDGNLRHDVVFASDEVIQEPSMEGKMVRITAQEYKGKLKGITLEDKEVKGKQKRSIKVTFPAKVELLDGDSQASSPPQSNQTTPSQTSRPMNQESSTEPVEVRIANYFGIFNRVCLAVGQDPDEVVGKLSPTDIKEISTGISMSYKGQYGVYAPPIFQGGATEAIAHQEEQVGKSRAITKELEDGETDSPKKTTNGKPKGWRDYLHPKKNVPLGELDEEGLAKLIDWAHKTENPPSEDGKALRPYLILADNELRKPLMATVAKALAKQGMGQSFDEGEVDEVCQAEWKVDYNELTFPQLVQLNGSLKEYVADMKSLYDAKKTAPKKIAKKPIAQDDGDLPD